MSSHWNQSWIKSAKKGSLSIWKNTNPDKGRSQLPFTTGMEGWWPPAALWFLRHAQTRKQFAVWRKPSKIAHLNSPRLLSNRVNKCRENDRQTNILAKKGGNPWSKFHPQKRFGRLWKP